MSPLRAVGSRGHIASSGLASETDCLICGHADRLSREDLKSGAFAFGSRSVRFASQRYHQKVSRTSRPKQNTVFFLQISLAALSQALGIASTTHSLMIPEMLPSRARDRD